MPGVRKRSGFFQCILKNVLSLDKTDRSRMLESEGFMAGNKVGHQEPLKIVSFLWPRVVELWIFVAIATFLILRVITSRSAQHFFGFIKSNHLL